MFRLTTSLNRYWEGRSAIQTVQSKLMTACQGLILFDESPGTPQDDGYAARVCHYISLLQAVMLQYLRNDYELNNLEPLTKGGEAGANLPANAIGIPSSDSEGAAYDQFRRK